MLVVVVVVVVVAVAHAGVQDDLAAARALQSSGRSAAAESLATSVLERLRSEPAPDSLEIADVMALIVSSRERRGARGDSITLPLARSVLAIRMRHLPPDDPRLARAHDALARVWRSRGDPDSAQTHARRAYEIRRRSPAPDDTLIAESLRLLGAVSRDRSDYVAAADYLERAFQLRLRAHGEDRRIMAQLLYEKGTALREIGEIDQARADLVHAIAIDERLGGHDGADRADDLDGLAALERQVGNLARAMELWQEALRVARLHHPEDDPHVVRIRRNSNAALIELGDYAGAARLMESVTRAYEKSYGPDHPNTISAHNSLGIAWVSMGDSLRGMRELRAVESLLDARPGPADPRLGTNLKFQMALLQQRGDHAAALAMCRRAIARIRGNEAAQWLNLVELHMGAIHSQAALGDTSGLEHDRRELLRLAAQRPESATNIAQDVRLADAIALRALGRIADAWDQAIAADRMARERLQINTRSLPELRSLQLSQSLSATTDLVIDLARAGSDTQREQAWDALVRIRGLVRAEMARRRLPAEALRDTALAGIHERWVAAQRRYAQRLVAATRDAAGTFATPVEGLRAAAEESERDLAHALADRGRAPERGEIGLAEVRGALAPGRALVGFVETEAGTDTARITAFIARAGARGIAWVELGRSAALRAVIQEWQDRLATPPGGGRSSGSAATRAERRAGRAVRERTWDLVAPRLRGVSEVLIVPDGPLLGMSWQALPEGERGYRVEEGPTLHTLNAEREWVERRETAPAGALLAVGAADFGSEATHSLPRRLAAMDPCAAGLPVFRPLPATGVEVRDVAARWRGPAEVLAGAAASEEAFKRRAAGHTVLHVATHGVVARDTCFGATAGLRGVGGVGPLSASSSGSVPLSTHGASPATVSPWLGRRVWLALAGANRAAEHTSDENEGLLTAEEVLTLDLTGTDWVVLSACRSGTGESWSREGVLGMRRAFHLAGARTVIASEWSVDDDATREWMDALYAARAHGAGSAAAAVASASRTILAQRRHAGRSTHPFYWAAFSASGE